MFWLLTRWVIPAVTVFLAIAVCIVLFAPDVSVRIKEDQVAEALAEHLPYEVDTRTLQLNVEAAQVRFLDSGKVGVKASFDGRLFGLSGSGSTDTESGLRYDDGRFYLSELRVSELALEPNRDDQSVIDDARSVASGLFNRLRDEAGEGDSEAPGAMDRMAERIKPVVRDTMDRWVQNIPVYDLERAGFKGQAARLALKDIRITQGEAIAIFSPAQAAAKIASAVLATILLILVVFVWMRAADLADS